MYRTVETRTCLTLTVCGSRVSGARPKAPQANEIPKQSSVRPLPPLADLPDGLDRAAVGAERMHDAVLVN